MSRLQKAVQDYIDMRRALGFKLTEAAVGLRDFVSFLKRRSASHITIPLALEWAQQNPAVQPSQWAQRLTWVRCFARYRSATDGRTQIPPWGLLPHRPRRARPYLYTEEEIQQLLEGALQLGGLRGWTYYSLFGLLCVTGLRLSEALNLREPAFRRYRSRRRCSHDTNWKVWQIPFGADSRLDSEGPPRLPSTSRPNFPASPLLLSCISTRESFG